MSDIGNIIALPNALEGTVTAGKPVCLLCGSTTVVSLSGVFDNRLGTPGTYEIHRCGACGLEQTFPAPSVKELKELYETHYNFGGEKDTLYTKFRETFFFSSLYRLWMWLDGDAAFYRRSGRGRLLDVGCNEGRGLRMYARNGFQAEGLDLNETAAAMARKAGFKVHTCLLEEFNAASLYDVVVLSNVLEHTLDPRQMLLDARRVLTRGGKVWVSCPNSESWLRGLFGRSWINWHVPFHISHFCQTTLCQLLVDTGFAPVEIRLLSPALWVAQSFIAHLFASEGKKNQQLRNPFWVGAFMVIARFILFPMLWLANRRGRGDCLLVVAAKA